MSTGEPVKLTDLVSGLARPDYAPMAEQPAGFAPESLRPR